MRERVVRLLSTGPGPSMGGCAESYVSRLLADANRDPAHDSHDALSAIANNVALSIEPNSTMTAWRWITLQQLAAFVQARVYYLRRCPHCDKWFLTGRKTRRTCFKTTCRTKAQRAADAKRQAALRKREYEAQRRARARVTKKGTKRT